MKRTPLKRKARLKSTGPPKVKVTLKARAVLRRAGKSRFPKLRDPDYLAYIAGLPCEVAGCRNFPSDPAHVRSRGAGGADRGNTVPLCHQHHEEQHRIGITSFSDRYRLNLTYRAAVLLRGYRPPKEVP